LIPLQAAVRALLAQVDLRNYRPDDQADFSKSAPASSSGGFAYRSPYRSKTPPQESELLDLPKRNPTTDQHCPPTGANYWHFDELITFLPLLKFHPTP